MLPDHFSAWFDPQARFRRSSHATVLALRGARGVANRHVAIEVGAGGTQFFGSAEMRDCRRGYIAAPTVFERHGDPHAHADILDCLVFVRPPSLLILRFTTSIAKSALARSSISRRDVFIEHKGVISVAADGEAFLVR